MAVAVMCFLWSCVEIGHKCMRRRPPVHKGKSSIEQRFQLLNRNDMMTVPKKTAMYFNNQHFGAANIAEGGQMGPLRAKHHVTF